MGIIIGIVTWILHRYALKPLADKLPWLAWLSPPEEKPESPTK